MKELVLAALDLDKKMRMEVDASCYGILLTLTIFISFLYFSDFYILIFILFYFLIFGQQRGM